MRIALYGRNTPDNLTSHVQQLISSLEQKGAILSVYKPFYEFLQQKIKFNSTVGCFLDHNQLKQQAEYLFSLGGDGTFLETISFIRNSGIPVLGINTGRLGFLANVSKEEIDQAILGFFQKKYSLQPRALIKVETKNKLFGDFNYGLNECTVVKKDSSSMVSINAYVNDIFMNSYWADGLIVATPTGSTAYSLSCGGPIVMPGSKNFVITPIAPHNLNVRPFVISDDNVIKLKIEGRSDQFLLSLDSRSVTINAAEEIVISREKFDLQTICLDDQNFFNTIRNKLLWGIDKRN